MSKIVFTDLDGTLTLRDTYHIFIFHNLTMRTIIKNSYALVKMGAGYLLGSLSKEQVKRASFAMFFDGYDTTQDLTKFVSKIPWNRVVLEQVNAKRAEGYQVILVTASPDIYLEAICEHLEYDGFLATKTFREGNYTTGIFDGAVCNFEEKKRRIQEFLENEKTTYTISYGNSSGDYEMLRLCDESYFVKKSDIKKFT